MSGEKRGESGHGAFELLFITLLVLASGWGLLYLLTIEPNPLTAEVRMGFVFMIFAGTFGFLLFALIKSISLLLREFGIIKDVRVKNGDMVYNWYRLDKNISWFNVSTFVFGLIYGVLTLRLFRKSGRYLLHCGKIWLPPRWEIK